MRNRLTRRQFVAGGATSLGISVGLSGCLGDDDGVPDVSFGFERDGTELTVTHNGGESLDENNTGAVEIHESTGNILLGDWELPIEEGNSLTVQANFEPEQTVVVRWVTPDLEEFAELDSFDIE